MADVVVKVLQLRIDHTRRLDNGYDFSLVFYYCGPSHLVYADFHV